MAKPGRYRKIAAMLRGQEIGILIVIRYLLYYRVYIGIVDNCRAYVKVVVIRSCEGFINYNVTSGQSAMATLLRVDGFLCHFRLSR